MIQFSNDHIFARPDRVLVSRHEKPFDRAELYVLTTVFNPARYRSRLKLYQDFAKRVKQSGAKLFVAEIAFGHRQFVIGENDPVPPDYLLQLESTSELWVKEAALNVLMSRLPIDWQYLATVDADVAFARDDWANETVQQLQHYDVVQMWSEAQDLGPDHTTIASHHSFVYSWRNGEQMPEPCGYYGKPTNGVHFYHPGFAWAYRRKAINDLGRLIDFAILGAADNHMAKALIGEAEHSLHPNIGQSYRDRVLQWQHNALTYIQKNIGYVPGNLFHYFHGSKLKRGYWSRWRILVDNHFDPDTDLKYDWQGLPQLVVETERQQKIRDQLRDYFSSRDEDSSN